ncbi:MAG: endonuclease III [Myxococcaceae bacterium]|nr:endonuclease III [Myxococcaceae bacterium]
MAREALADKRRRAAEVIRRLDAAMPEAEIELDFETPLELLVAVLLSAQTTDKRVNLVTPALFRDFKTAADYAATTPKVLEGYLKTVGLFRNKSKALVKLGRELVAQHDGEVPRSRAALAELPGVGNKTAGVVAIHLGDEKAFPVDTHILRLSRRLGLSRHLLPDPVEADLRRLLPEDLWFKAHQLIIWHGRRVCDARKPACHRCVLVDLCPRRGVRSK